MTFFRAAMGLRARRWRSRSAASVSAFIVAAGCASFRDDSNDTGNGRGVEDGGTSIVVVEGGATDARSLGAPGVSPLCGPGVCFQHLPDDPDACVDFDGGARPVKVDAGLGTGGAPGKGKGKQDASVGRPDAALDASDGSFDSGSADGSGTSNPVPVADASEDADAHITEPLESGVRPPVQPPMTFPTLDAGPLFACQIQSDDSGFPVHRCGRAGPGDVAAPCASSEDCRAGLACVGEQGAGQCRPFCCDVVNHPCATEKDASADKTFCAERPLLELGKPNAMLPVPVCVPAVPCRLDEPFPCSGPACTCTGGTACTIVRGDGTTSCVKPGKTNEHCPCDAGYFCSQADGQCVKICKTGSDESCAPGMCQATAGFPMGFGLCVGAKPAMN